MFVWCAYCQRYSGERAPYDQYTLTHGICATCQAREITDEEILAMREISAFYGGVLESALAGQPVSDFIARGRALGLRSLDLLVGILQPVLYEVGKAWERGTIATEVEARFSKLCDEVITTLDRELVVTSGRRIMLLAAHWNRHTLGLRMTAYRLRDAGFDVRVVAPTPPLDQLCSMIEAIEPEIVGVSVATEWQLGFLEELAAIIATSRLRPRIVAGGLAVRAGVELPAGVERWDPSSERV